MQKYAKKCKKKILKYKRRKNKNLNEKNV